MEKMQTGRRIITTLPVHGHQNRLIYALTMLLIAKIIIFRLLGIRQGGKSARTVRYETVKFPIAFTAIFSITGQALTSYVLAGSDSNFGIKNNFSVTEFTTSMYDNGNYYAGFHWVAFGLA